MLQSLHVKNLALIEETEVEFGEGLNILTGETGAGKSLLIGSVNLALGGKFEKEMLRKGADSALVELIFRCDDEKVRQRLVQMELEDEEDGTVIISRKMTAGKSVCRVNGETVTTRQVKELAELLLDIHGQHEHQSLLHKKNHLAILDTYCGEKLEQAMVPVTESYYTCNKLRMQIEEETLDEESKAKERALAEFEAREISDAKLVPGEDEELETRYRRMVNSKKIMESLGESYGYTGNDGESGAGSALSRALRALRSVADYDKQLEQLEEQLMEVDNLLADFNRDLSDYMSGCEFDAEEFHTVEERLNRINHLKGKYGNTIEDVLAYGESREELLHKLDDYDSYMEGLRLQLKQCEQKLDESCGRVSEIRRNNAEVLTAKLKNALLNLNFLTVEFEISVKPGCAISSRGYDEVEFLISTNPGEILKPLSQVASGGELSRVMLAIKTVLAGKDGIDTLIFDEIDAGISGRTAWKVSEQLAQVGKKHQVLCITHLPQIAAMADRHFVIEKSSNDEQTITDIRALGEEECLGELARLLGSDTLTEAALENAKDMREKACEYKKQLQV